MVFRKLFGLFIILLILGGLFGWGRRNEYQAGYAQGYVAGQQSVAQGEDGGTAVSPPVTPHYPAYHYRGFGFFEFLFKGFFLFMGFMLLMGLLFGRGHWHGKHGRHHHKWHHEWHKSSQKPPWYDDEADEPLMKA
jgi:hypothetical protein